MSNDERCPLRFWIGLHKDGVSRQCIVDFDGGPMEGVKAAWNKENVDAASVTTMETVIALDLSQGERDYLELLTMLERRLGDSRLPELEKFLRHIAMAAYQAGMQNAGLRPKRP